MPSNNRRHSNGVNGATETKAVTSADPVVEAATTDAAHVVADRVEEAAKPTAASVDDVKRTVSNASQRVQTEAHAYVDKGKQALEEAKESARETAANIQRRTYEVVDNAKKTAQPYVDQAKEAAAPYVDGARQAVENSKEKVQAVRNTMDKKVEEIHKFDITKTTFFAVVVVFTATILSFLWRCVEAVGLAKVVAVAIRDAAAAVGLSGKLWEIYYYSTVALEHVPVVGYRSAHITRTYVEEVVDESRKQIRQHRLKNVRKAN